MITLFIGSSPEPQTVPTTSAAASADPISELSPRQSKIRDIKQVLLCSNATPIWSHNSRANMCYKCSYCELKYARLDRLKKHTLDEHDDITEARFFRGKHDLFHEIYVKLDITALNCKLCCGNFDDINTLIEHLNQIHKKRVDVKVTNFLLPFKFFSETLYCGICSKKDSTFKSLEQHLNVHMKIYKCKKCDEVFTTYRMLQIHDDAEHKHNPPKKIVKRRSSNLPFLCRECGETFPSEYRQRVHVAKVHKEPNNYHCKACDRVYDRADELRVHTRRDHLMERRFKCKVCDKAFYAQATMLKHELSHSNEKKYSCDVCGKAFKCKTSLFPHMQIHADDRRFKCEVCGRAFVQKASWQGHMRSKHDLTFSGNPEPEKVPTTAATSADPISEMSSAQRKLHGIKQVLLWSNATPLRSHSGLGYKCSYCELKYPRLDRLKNHTLEEHDDFTEARFLKTYYLYQDSVIKLDVTSLSCKLCSANFDNLITLIEHLNETHKKRIGADVELTSHFFPFSFDSEELHCGVCSNRYTSFEDLEQHMKLHLKIFNCNICDEGFTSQGKLNAHYNATHRNNKPSQKNKKIRDPSRRYTCPECSETFPTPYSHRVHVRIVHKGPRIYQCKACDRAFVRRDQLRIHTRRDHLMERRFKCRVCDKAFYAQATMLKHELSHTNEMKYACDVCGKAFKFKTSLYPHMQIHAGDRRFKCEVCGQEFTQKASWQGHMRFRALETSVLSDDVQILQEDLREFRTLKVSATSADPISELTPRQRKIRDMKQVLLWSTATPVWSHSDVGYKCSYCELKYPRPDRLKKHTLEEHDDIAEARFLRAHYFTDVFVKLDLTALCCKLCCASFDNLDTLIAHLNLTHKKRIEADIANNLLPFKFYSETLHCGICSKTYSTFKTLEQHLNVHRKIYECKICDEIFTCKGKLQIHDNAVHKINSLPKKIIPKKGSNWPHVCKECGERFPNRYTMVVHANKVHKGPANYHNCNACDRVFELKQQLVKHIRRDHLMERRYQCSVCSKAFFTNSFLLKHEVTHSGEMKYSCNVCGKRFKFKTSLGPHMAIHSGVRRFKYVLSSTDEDELPLAAEKSITLCRKVNFSSFISIPPGGTPETNKTSHKKKKLPQKVQKRKISEVVEEKPPEKVELKRTLPTRKSASKRKNTSEQRVKIPHPNPKTRLTEMDWHLDNIRTILNCSNATPIHAKEDGGHSCSYCFQKFSKLTELKKHCFSNHKKGKPDFLKMRPGKILSKHIVYLDISSLKCRVCRADIESLEMLMEHLQNAHDETMHLVIKNQIMPLRVVDEILRCAVCAVDVEFDKVADHMSQHYRNYVCEFCDASFVIRCKMLDHKKTGT
ncbi:Uncharacterized protein OBRU01_12676 [Operophtera brumata]|uniref:C2H2-type domain-containing protein n=1 Tax=Operophtera brumata TaxID=104452 RepID=A0A0L7L9T0_OPEBR|nr:Uncharacterized protein OBRU01_12676 [Operophtera brumata]